MKYFHDKRNIEEFIFFVCNAWETSDLSRQSNINRKIKWSCMLLYSIVTIEELFRNILTVIAQWKMFIKKATENAFLKMWKVFFHVKNAFHNLVNAFINRKRLSRFRGTHSLPFHTFMERFPLSSKFVLHIDGKRSGPFFKPME